ncbi:MAG: protein phosphatase 2C domain-containing protein [Myxococcales bacterium]|nr:protein phosphatase 2C domain-containing protein [Myxococcales bacterium]
MTAFAIAGVVHPGLSRPSNEDRVVIDAAHGLAVVADGMGGELGGERAAEDVSATIARTVANGGELAAAFEAARGALAAHGDDPGIERPGATLAALRIRPERGDVEIGHAGDVRVYVLRRAGAPSLVSPAPRYCPPHALASGATLACVTRDHTSICELVERGHVEPAAAAGHPLRSRVSRAIGRADAREELQVLALAAGDRLLVCSDGLWSGVDPAAIAAVLDQAPTAELACEQLLAAALAAGGADNIGIAVVSWGQP